MHQSGSRLVIRRALALPRFATLLNLQQSEVHVVDLVALALRLEVALRQVLRLSEFVDTAQVPFVAQLLPGQLIRFRGVSLTLARYLPLTCPRLSFNNRAQHPPRQSRHLFILVLVVRTPKLVINH